MKKQKTGSLIPIGVSLIERLVCRNQGHIVHNRNRILFAPAMIAAVAAVCLAQSVISARSGLLHYFEGDVSVDSAQVESKAGRFPEIKEQSILSTAQGRAEVLLTPGVFLRIGENSAIRMLDRRLASTWVEIRSGTIIVESDDPEMSIKDPPVTLIYKDYKIQLVKHGLVEISSDPGQMKIYKGEAAVDITGAAGANDRVAVSAGRMLSFSKSLNIQKFDTKIGGDLFLWARDRSQSLSAANMSSARSLNTNNPEYGNGLGGRYTSSSQDWAGGWYFNPYFNMYTFVPSGGTSRNFWGHAFFSPATISSCYMPSTSVLGPPFPRVSAATKTHPVPVSSLRGRNSGGLPALESSSGNELAIRPSSSTSASTGFTGPSGGHMSANGPAGAAHRR